MPVNNENFTQSMVTGNGVITGAGFETPAETLYLGKKLLCLPIQGQYEQFCNAEALKDFGVPVIHSINEAFPALVKEWLGGGMQQSLSLEHSTTCIIEKVIEKAIDIREHTQYISSPGLKFSV